MYAYFYFMSFVQPICYSLILEFLRDRIWNKVVQQTTIIDLACNISKLFCHSAHWAVDLVAERCLLGYTCSWVETANTGTRKLRSPKALSSYHVENTGSRPINVTCNIGHAQYLNGRQSPRDVGFLFTADCSKVILWPQAQENEHGWVLGSINLTCYSASPRTGVTTKKKVKRSSQSER